MLLLKQRPGTLFVASALLLFAVVYTTTAAGSPGSAPALKDEYPKVPPSVEKNAYDLDLHLPPTDGSFKIWMYPFSDDFLLQGRVSTDFRLTGEMEQDSGYIWEVLLTDAVRDPKGPFAPYMTEDPDEATLRIIPMYPTAWMHTWVHDGIDEFGRKVAPLVWNVMNRVTQEWPYWNESLGTDHVIVFSHDIGLSVIGDATLRDMLSSAIAVQPLGSYHLIPSFRPNKDIVVPPYETNDEYRRRALQGQIPGPESRTILCSFKGGIMLDAPDYSGGVRQFIYRTYKNTTGFEIYETSDESSPGYRTLLDSSIFCLYLPGWLPARWSGRLIHLLTSGCIPVIIIDDLELPFEHVLDWGAFSVRVTEKQLYAGHLPKILENVSVAERLSKLETARLVAALFSSPYSTRSNPLRVEMDHDLVLDVDKSLNVFHLVLSSLYVRARRFGLLKSHSVES